MSGNSVIGNGRVFQATERAALATGRETPVFESPVGTQYRRHRGENRWGADRRVKPGPRETRTARTPQDPGYVVIRSGPSEDDLTRRWIDHSRAKTNPERIAENLRSIAGRLTQAANHLVNVAIIHERDPERDLLAAKRTVANALRGLQRAGGRIDTEIKHRVKK